MNEELIAREGTEEAMMAKDEAATFDPLQEAPQEEQFEMPANGDAADLSDDDIAAALGFHTTLSEPLIPQDEMDTAEDEAVETADESPETAEDADEEVEEEPEEEKAGKKVERDDAQDEEIQSILEELEGLQKEVYGGEKTENTESAE